MFACLGRLIVLAVPGNLLVFYLTFVPYLGIQFGNLPRTEMPSTSGQLGSLSKECRCACLVVQALKKPVSFTSARVVPLILWSKRWVRKERCLEKTSSR